MYNNNIFLLKNIFYEMKFIDFCSTDEIKRDNFEKMSQAFIN